MGFISASPASQAAAPLCAQPEYAVNREGLEMEVTFTLTFLSAFPDTQVAAGECLITS